MRVYQLVFRRPFSTAPCPALSPPHRTMVWPRISLCVRRCTHGMYSGKFNDTPSPTHPPPSPPHPPPPSPLPQPLASNQCTHAVRGRPSLQRARARLNAGRGSPGRSRRHARRSRHPSTPRPEAMCRTARLLKAAARARRRSRSWASEVLPLPLPLLPANLPLAKLPSPR